ncbi:MAG: hemin uptake protein HemP [Thiobacillus sp.]|nr:hemin uptake protein HemP [Thiobacillus sp.]
MNPDQPESRLMQIQSSVSGHSPAGSGMRPFPPGAITTDSLFQGRQEILINHNGEHYRLRITKNSKLILTK